MGTALFRFLGKKQRKWVFYNLIVFLCMLFLTYLCNRIDEGDGTDILYEEELRKQREREEKQEERKDSVKIIMDRYSQLQELKSEGMRLKQEQRELAYQKAVLQYTKTYKEHEEDSLRLALIKHYNRVVRTSGHSK